MLQRPLNETQAATFVTGLYRSILGRDPDPAGLQDYVRRLVAGGDKAEIRRIFLQSDEYARRRRQPAPPRRAGQESGTADAPVDRFPDDYQPPGEAGKCYRERRHSGFFDKYCSGPLVLDVGYSGYDNPEGRAALPHAVGIDLDTPGYDGIHLPYGDGSVDTVFSSHCLEHILCEHAAIADWYRVLKYGGFIVCTVPSQALYEKKRFLPSTFNADHKRMYTPSSLVLAFETALAVNSYRIRHLAENDHGFDYGIGPGEHSTGAYEIEIVVEKIVPSAWTLA